MSLKHEDKTKAWSWAAERLLAELRRLGHGDALRGPLRPEFEHHCMAVVVPALRRRAEIIRRNRRIKR